MLNKPAVVQTVQQPAAGRITAAGPAAVSTTSSLTAGTAAGGLFGPALERARSQSRGREARQQQQGGAAREQQEQGGGVSEQSGNRQQTWAERAAKRSRRFRDAGAASPEARAQRLQHGGPERAGRCCGGAG